MEINTRSGHLSCRIACTEGREIARAVVAIYSKPEFVSGALSDNATPRIPLPEAGARSSRMDPFRRRRGEESLPRVQGPGGEIRGFAIVRADRS